MHRKTIFFLLLLSFGNLLAQDVKPLEITSDWLAKMESLAPSETAVKTQGKKRIMVFSKATGYDHWTIPHNAEVLKILGRKTGAFEITIAYDIDSFDKDNLLQYDAIILNNSNPAGPKRDLFDDLLSQNTNLSEAEISKLAPIYEKNLMDYVAEGGGLMLLHGAITVQNNSIAFSKMTGGSFDYHPKQQEIHVKEVDVNHPLVNAFKGKGFIHTDEPYFFKNAYFDYNFRPLLYMEVDQLEGLKEVVAEKIIYVSWIKRHGKGRVFYTSPSHNAQSMEKPELLQFFLDGLQYVVGDLQCDDSPIRQPGAK